MYNLSEILEVELSNVGKIKETLVERVKIPLYALNNGGNYNAPSDTFGIYKNTGGDCLGIVKNQYHPFSIHEAYDNFTEALMIMGADLNGVSHTEYGLGGKEKFSCKIKEFEFVNGAGLNDVTEVSINMMLGYDGRTKSTLFLSTKRLICLNGAKITQSEVEFRYKNTQKNNHVMTHEIMNMAKLYHDAMKYQDIVEAMNAAKVTDEQIQLITEQVAGVKKKELEDRSSTMKNIYASVSKAIDLELSRTGKNAWGLLNGVTYYTNHLASGSGDEYIYVNSGLEKNKIAENFCMSLI